MKMKDIELQEALAEVAVAAYSCLGKGNAQSRANFSFTRQNLFYALLNMSRAYNMNNLGDETAAGLEETEYMIYEAMAKAETEMKRREKEK